MAHIVDRYEQLPPHDQKNLVAALQELLQACVDGQAGYTEAANDVEDPGLRYLLTSFAEQRATFRAQLANALERLGRHGDPTPSVGGELHRMWTHARAVLERHEPTALIAECERGEHHALRKWESALQLAMPLELEGLLLDQVTEIRKAREGLERMRHPW